MLTEKQKAALDVFIAENEVDLYDLKNETARKIREDEAAEREAKRTQMAKKKEPLIDRYFYGERYGIGAYYYVISPSDPSDDKVNCLRIFKTPWSGTVESAIFLEALDVEEISYKEFSKFTEISAEEYEEGYMRAVKLVLEMRKSL